VPLVVAGHRGSAAALQWQPGLRAIERLNLAFLIDAQNERAIGRVHVEPDDVGHFFLEQRIARHLEALDQVRLDLGPERLSARRSRLIPQKPLDALLREAPLPAPHRRLGHPGRARHRVHRQTLRRQLHDPRPPNDFGRRVTARHQPLEPSVILRCDRDLCPHPHDMTDLPPQRNPQSETEH
jgi:hypothetical protein